MCVIFLFTPHHIYVVGLTRRRSLTWVTWFSWLVWFHRCVAMCTEFAMYGVGWFLARCWIVQQLFLLQMCSVHWGRWTTLPIRWARQNCEILIMVFGIKFKLFTYHYRYVTWNISASWKFFYRSWFQRYTVTVWDAGTWLCLLCRHVHS